MVQRRFTAPESGMARTSGTSGTPGASSITVGRRSLFGGAAALAFAGTTMPRAQAAGSGVSAAADEPFELVWSEDFSGGSLDESVWELELGNIRGNEQQHYSSGADNVRVKNGQLVIAATDRPLADQYRNTARHGANARLVKYNSGSIRTHARMNFLYGKLEIRARLPKGKGAFPAIWMLGHEFHLDGRLAVSQGTGWPSCGELDIMEIIGAPTAERAAQGETPSFAWNSNKTTYGTPHFAYANTGNPDGDGTYSPYALGGVKTITNDFYDAYHVFGVNRTPDKLEWLLDGVVFKTLLFTDPDPLENQRRQAAAAGMLRPHYLQINLATGGNWAGDAGDFLAADNTDLVIDWVRHSQTPSQKAADGSYHAGLPVLTGVQDVAIRQGQSVDLSDLVSVDRPGYMVAWSVNDTPMFVNGGVPGGRNEVRLVATSDVGPQSLAELPVGVYSLYYTALPEGTDMTGTSKQVPSVPADRAKATLAVLPAEGLKGKPRGQVKQVDLPEGWTWADSKQELNKDDEFGVVFVNPLDVTTPVAKRPRVTFTLSKGAITN